jgi:hypothetical protein
VLRLVGAVQNATVSMTVTATKPKSGGGTEPADTAVDFYPSTVTAEAEPIHALYTIFIPADYGATVNVELSASTKDGHITLGAAALTSDGRSDPSPKLAFTSGLQRTLTVDTLTAPDNFNLSNPGGTAMPVASWRHATVREFQRPTSAYTELRYSTYTYEEIITAPDLQFPNNPGNSITPCDGGYYSPRYDQTNSTGGGDRTAVGDPLAALIPSGGKASWSYATAFSGYEPAYGGPASGSAEVDAAVATVRCPGAVASGMARVAVLEPLYADAYLYVLAGARGGDYLATAVFGETLMKTVTSASANGGAGSDPAMSLYRILLPAGTTGDVTFSIPTNAAADAMFIIGGISIQLIPPWESCTLPADYAWDEFLTSGDSVDLAKAPYFQQFQLRALLNRLNLTPPVNKFDHGRLTAAYCEAKAWTEPPGPGDPGDKLHPDQNGYGYENEGGPGDPENPTGTKERDENPGGDGDEVDDSDQNDGDLHQPMGRLTKRAFKCWHTADDKPYSDPTLTDPNVLTGDTTHPTPPVECLELSPDSEGKPPKVTAGTTVYWLFTLSNIAELSYIEPPAGGWVNDKIGESGTLTRVCQLEWELTPGLTTEDLPDFPATLRVSPATPVDWIWPGQARACVSSAVLK